LIVPLVLADYKSDIKITLTQLMRLTG